MVSAAHFFCWLCVEARSESHRFNNLTRAIAALALRLVLELPTLLGALSLLAPTDVA